MNWVIVAFLILINLFAVLLNLKMLVGISNGKKATIIVIEELILFVIMNIVYALCSANIEVKNPAGSRTFDVFTFMGINMMIITAPISKLLGKFVEKDLKKAEFSSKLKIKIVIAIIILIIEALYIRSLLEI